MIPCSTYLPKRIEGGKTYRLDTTSFKGTYSTPNFRQHFEENTFERSLEVYLYITIPDYISAKNTIIVDIDYDIEQIRSWSFNSPICELMRYIV